MNNWPKEIYTIFHRLWGKSVGNGDYDKKEWKKLQLYIEELQQKLVSLGEDPRA